MADSARITELRFRMEALADRLRVRADRLDQVGDTHGRSKAAGYRTAAAHINRILIRTEEQG